MLVEQFWVAEIKASADTEEIGRGHPDTSVAPISNSTKAFSHVRGEGLVETSAGDIDSVLTPWSSNIDAQWDPEPPDADPTGTLAVSLLSWNKGETRSRVSRWSNRYRGEL